MNSENTPSPLAKRFKRCVEECGRQVDFLSKVSFSRAQLDRYLKAQATPSLENMEEAAKVSGISLAWLVTGKGEPLEKHLHHSVTFNRAQLENTIKLFEETLMEYQGAFTPAQKGVLIPLIQAALEHEQKNGVNAPFEKYDMYCIFHYVESFKKNESLDIFRNTALHLINKDHDTNHLEEKDLSPFTNLVCKAYGNYFSSPMGEHYFDRTNGPLSKLHLKVLNKVMQTVFELLGNKPLKLVDLGCGSGRHLIHIHNAYPQISLSGLELSSLPLGICKAHEASGRLPAGTVLQGDIRTLPYPSDTYDVVTSRAVLHYIPYFPNTGTGAEKVFAEVGRILKPGGLFYCDMRYGHHREYLPFNQSYNEKSVKQLAEKHGFELVWQHSAKFPTTPELDCDWNDVHNKYKDFIHVMLRKKQ